MDGRHCDVLIIFPPIRTWDAPRNFPTGPGLIAGRLRQAGYTVAVIDANGLRLSDAAILDQIDSLRPGMIGFGGLITTYGWIKSFSKKIKQRYGDMPMVLGGSVGTSIVDTALRHLDIDVIAIGEADDTILELVPALLNGKTLDDIAGLAWREGDTIRRSAARPLRDTLDDLPYPAWDLFAMDVYLQNPVVGIGRDVDVISSRGCPFNCQYCYKIFGRTFRGRSAEHVVGEMEQLKRDYDVDFISFQDDCFVIDKKRVYAICDLIDRSKVLKGIRWSCNGRVTVCDKSLLERMKASGCVSVAYGIESGSATMLAAMHKQMPLDQAAEVIRMTRDTGMRVPLAFMMGYPGETRDTIMETVAFCKSLNIPLAGMTFTCPYPGTPLYHTLRAEGELLADKDEETLVLRMGDAVDLAINLTDMPDEELIALRKEALALAKANYVPPTAEQLHQQDLDLYGPELLARAQAQLNDPKMKAHRKRHGFNEADLDDAADAKADDTMSVSDFAHAMDHACLNIGAAPVPWHTKTGTPYIIAEAGVNHNGRR